MEGEHQVKVEAYDGAYDCLICGTSVRGQPALHCTVDPHCQYVGSCPRLKTVLALEMTAQHTAVQKLQPGARKLRERDSVLGHVQPVRAKDSRY
jgi:hypothetical protein